MPRKRRTRIGRLTVERAAWLGAAVAGRQLLARLFEAAHRFHEYPGPVEAATATPPAPAPHRMQ